MKVKEETAREAHTLRLYTHRKSIKMQNQKPYYISRRPVRFRDKERERDP